MDLSRFYGTRLPVVEIFTSISGEGISAGEVVTFIRCAGCNLRCSYCDTKYSYNEKSNENEYLLPEEILKRIEELGCKKIIITGGEPLEENKQKRYLPLYLASKGYNIRIETNGSTSFYTQKELELFNARREKISYAVDVKCPSSQMDKKDIMHKNSLELKQGDEIKFIVGSDEDINFAMDIIKKYKEIISDRNIVVNFSPVFDRYKSEEIVNFMIRENQFFLDNDILVRLSLQIHKFIWNPEARGV
ncbi:MAG: radical SAM protein [Bacillota bacterium]|nr:radical SAM protein [Bacillota bacterium]